jgi:serine/threonine protein kinase
MVPPSQKFRFTVSTFPDGLQEFLLKHGFIVNHEIGSGRTSVVYLAASARYTSTKFAIKRVDRFHESACLDREMTVLKTLTHPNVIQLYEYFEDGIYSYVVLEYCPGGSVKDHVALHGPYQGADLLSACGQVVAGLAYCHSLGISHGDIKPHNILIDSYNRCKLADFGLSERYAPNETSKRFLGSLPYMAPEVLEKRAFDPFAADVWSLGVTFYWMATGITPWHGQDIIQEAQCGIPPLPGYVADGEFRKLVRMMGDPDPTRRISIDEVAAHPIWHLMEPLPTPRVRANASMLRLTPVLQGAMPTTGSAVKCAPNTVTPERRCKLGAASLKLRASTSSSIGLLLRPPNEWMDEEAS